MTRPELSDVPSAPRRPSRRAHKLIFRYTGRQKVLRLVGIVFSIVGVGMMVPLLWGLPSDIAIALSGSEVTGQVLRLGEASYSVNDQTPNRVHYRYAFAGSERESYSDTFDLSSVGIREDDAPTSPVRIEVATLWPESSRIVGTRRWVIGPLGLIFLLFPATGGLTLFFAIRSNRREIRAFVHGVPTIAKVVSVGEDHSTSINGRHPILLAWEFRVGDEVYTGSISSMIHLDFEEFFDASQVVVLYDPARPEINTLYIR